MKTILVLEDDPSNMQVFCALLGSIGYNVLEATTGEEAIALGNHQFGSIDLFISDVAVPKPSGTDVAVELLKSHAALPILFISGTPMYAWDGSDLRNFQQLPPDTTDFLEKPFRASALLDKVSGLLLKTTTCGVSTRTGRATAAT
jgi:two-component system cell cycle sensor histidine kinase/response regulator CckA